MPQGQPKGIVVVSRGREYEFPADATLDEIKESTGDPDVVFASAQPGMHTRGPDVGSSGLREEGSSKRMLVDLLPAAGALAAAPFTGGMSLLPAAATIGAGAMGGSVLRSQVNEEPESVMDATGTALKEGAMAAGGELLLRPVIKGAQAVLGRGAKSIARNLVGGDDAVAQTALRERVLPGIRTGEHNVAQRMAELNEAVGPALRSSQNATVDLGRVHNMPHTMTARKTAESVLDNADDIAQGSRVVEGVQNNPRLTKSTAEKAAEFAYGESRRSAPLSTTTGAVRRAAARDAFEGAGRAVPAAARDLQRMSDLVPVQHALASKVNVIEPGGIPTMQGRLAVAGINRAMGPAARTLQRGATSNPGVISALLRGGDAFEGADGESIRQALIEQLMMPAH